MMPRNDYSSPEAKPVKLKRIFDALDALPREVRLKIDEGPYLVSADKAKQLLREGMTVAELVEAIDFTHRDLTKREAARVYGPTHPQAR